MLTVETIKYSLKIWITSVLLAPASYFVISLIKGIINHKAWFEHVSQTLSMYLLYVLFGATFSFLTWLLFWLTIASLAYFSINRMLKTWLICIIGILLTMGTFIIFIAPADMLNFNDEVVILMYCNCFFIGAGTWLYRPIEL